MGIVLNFIILFPATIIHSQRECACVYANGANGLTKGDFTIGTIDLDFFRNSGRTIRSTFNSIKIIIMVNLPSKKIVYKIVE